MKEAGYSRYACDRAEREHEDGRRPIEFHQPSDKATDGWLQIEYRDTGGVTMSMALCPECTAYYRSIMYKYDRDMTVFSNEGM